MTRLDGVRARFARLDRPDRVLAWLALAVGVVHVLSYVGVADGALVGDENYYVDGGRALSNAVRDLVWLRSPDAAELDRIAVGSGWFMPGMPVVLTPLFLLVPHAPLPLVRGYLAVFGLALLLLTAWRVRRTFGRRAAAGVLVFPGLAPTYAVFAAAGWGDRTAGLVLLLTLCQAYTMVLTVRDRGPRALTWRDGAGLGLLAIASVYFRSSVSIVVVAVCVAAFAVSVALAWLRAGRTVDWRAWGRVVTTYAAAGVAFLAVLVPWSVAASAALEARVTTTVSVPTVLANTFGNGDEICFGECDLGSSIWFSPLRYSREQARATGLSEVDIADEMSAYARRDVTTTSYARDVGINVGHYLGKPARFVTLIRWEGSPINILRPAQWLTYVLFYPAMAMMLVLVGAVARRRFEDALLLLLLKVGVLTLLTQPFVHIAGPRYWSTMAPLLGVGAALLWRLRDQRQRDVRPAAADAAVVGGLRVAQLVLGLGFLAVFVTMALLAI